MYKLLVYDLNYELVNIIPISDKYEYDLTGVKTHLTGSTSPFIVVDETRTISNVTKEDIISFLLASQLKRLTAERDAEMEKGFYSAVKDVTYWFDKSDQDDFTQQLVLLALDSTIVDGIYWRTEKGMFNHTRDEFLAVSKEAETHKRKWKQVLWAIEDHLKQSITEYEHLFEIKSLKEEAQKLGITL